MKFSKWLNQSKVPIAVIAIGTLMVVYLFPNQKKELPVFGPQDFNPELVDLELQNTKVLHKVTDFSLVNQDGERITQDNYKNKIYVTDFFFTRCPSICPIMSNNMQKLQQEFLNEDDVMLLSMSVTPEMDSVPVLKEYALKNGVFKSKWNITTGDKKHIYDLARKSYFATVDYGDGGLQDFIHTPNFVLVDQKKQIRGVYNGTDTDDVNRLIGDIKSLAYQMN
ncbi:SCO family protein [Flagellimonas algicola]|uniref:SCO family protein n=1 Tax=Flagellimonas algicola TaxID=2583815 RepID=A0ABY2WP47_9FLAO|nr:SCO family protein [Allomuricauda algicola]TMU56761.1 SCO family protein [Allomuricauda algicola]